MIVASNLTKIKPVSIWKNDILLAGEAIMASTSTLAAKLLPRRKTLMICFNAFILFQLLLHFFMCSPFANDKFSKTHCAHVPSGQLRNGSQCNDSSWRCCSKRSICNCPPIWGDAQFRVVVFLFDIAVSGIDVAASVNGWGVWGNFIIHQIYDRKFITQSLAFKQSKTWFDSISP